MTRIVLFGRGHRIHTGKIPKKIYDRLEQESETSDDGTLDVWHYVTLEELEKKRYLAACDHSKYTENNYDVNFLADQMAINFSEPNFYDCVSKCYNQYPEAMQILGYRFDFS